MTPFTAIALAAVVAQTSPQPPSRPEPVPGGAAPAATRGAEAPVLTLDEALSLAAARNLDLRAAQARRRQATEAARQVRAGYLPAVTASGTFTLNEHEAVIPPGVLGPDSPEVTIVPREQLSGQVEANQVIFSPSLWYGIQAASRSDDVARLSLESARRDILFGVAQTYYGVASLQRGVEVAERLLEIARRQENDARVRYEAGAIAKVGRLRAEIDRTRAEQDLLRARNAAESARIALATLLDRPVDFRVEDPPEPALPADPASLEEVAVRERPDVLAARRSVDAARSARRSLTGNYLPDVSAFGRWTIQNAGGFTGEEDQWALGLAAQWRLLDGGRREAEIREASARIEETEASAAATALRARQEVRTALLDLESARANAVKAREQRELAAENQRLVDVSFRAGAATAVEQADAIAQLRNAELAYTDETLAAQLAALRLLQVAGASLR